MMRFNRRWLSSQILLLVIVGWVTGLACIHHFWLEPSIQSQVAKQESSASIRWIEQSLSALARERRNVDHLCEQLANAPEAAAIGSAAGNGPAAGLDHGLNGKNFSLVLCGRDRRVAAVTGWMSLPAPSRPEPVWAVGDDLGHGPIFPPALSAPVVTGLASLGGRTCLFARRPIGAADKPQGYVVLVRAIDYAMLQDLSDMTGVNVMVLDSTGPARGPAVRSDISSWSESNGTLSAEVQLKDSLGRPIGRLQVTGSVIDFNASAARVRSAYVVQLLWLIGSALVTFAVVYLLFIRPLAILVRRLSDRDLTSKRDRLSAGLFA
ncbi:MAG: CHASE4 domain-containing protein, partial [Phycisphaerae bacterium]|nr:CHASE4 domain-containing protein [Phycisphaerae bacterium]